jgi:molecular chaperone DnaK (HSP70)
MGKAVGIDLLEDGERLGGQMGRRQAILNPKGTISAANRFIGRTYDEVSSRRAIRQVHEFLEAEGRR